MATGRAIAYGFLGGVAGAAAGCAVGGIMGFVFDGNLSQAIADGVFLGALTWAAPLAATGFLNGEQELAMPRAPDKAFAGQHGAVVRGA